MNIDTLLRSLQWPQAHLNDKGKLAWLREGTDLGSTDLAMVLVSPNQVRAVLTHHWPDGPDAQHLEAVWSIGPHQDTVLTSFVYAGEAQDLNDDRAVRDFVGLVQALNAKPSFQVFGKRVKHAPVASPVSSKAGL